MEGRAPLWRRLFWSGERIRVVWRLLMFLGLLVLGVWGAVLIVPPPADMVSAGALVWQGAITLGASLLAGWVTLAVLEGRPPGALGFRLDGLVGPDVAVGLGIGAGVVAVLVATMVALGTVGYVSEAGTAAGWLIAAVGALGMLALPAAAEEALFRGYGFQVLVEGLGPAMATLIVSGAFALAHAANPNVSTFGMVNIFLAGVLLSAAYLRTASLWFATAVHLGWNWAIGALFDLPVSGMELLDAPLYDARLAGPSWLTGGAFGPEGGLAGTAGFGLALLAVWRWTATRGAARRGNETRIGREATR